MNENIYEKYIDDFKFLEFINKTFNAIAIEATVEELAEFAFGSIDEAITEFNLTLDKVEFNQNSEKG